MVQKKSQMPTSKNNSKAKEQRNPFSSKIPLEEVELYLSPTNPEKGFIEVPEEELEGRELANKFKPIGIAKF